MVIPFTMAMGRGAPEQGGYGLRVQVVAVHCKAHPRFIDHATHYSEHVGFLVWWNFVSHRLLWIVPQFTAQFKSHCGLAR